MAFPVPEADGPGPDRHHARYRWHDLIEAIATEAHAARLAVEELAGRPHDPRAMDLAGSILAVMQLHADTARRAMYDEQRIEALAGERAGEILAEHGIRRGRLRAV